MSDPDWYGQTAPPLDNNALAVPAAPQPASSGPPALPDDTDARLIARAAVAEGDANDPQSYQNIAGVIYNRMQKSGKSAAEVLAEPGQFEAYQNGHIQKVDPASPQFATALTATQPVLAGQVHVPFDSFYQPDIVAQRGSKAPFDPSEGTKIGTQLFGNGYGGKGVSLTPQQSADWEKLTAVDPGVQDAATGAPLTNTAQIAAARDAQARGWLDDKQPAGTSANPYYAKPGDDLSNVPEGGFYWDTAGHLQANTANGPTNPLMYGVEHGMNVIPATIGNALQPLAAISDNPSAKNELAGVNANNAMQTGEFNQYVKGGDAALGNIAGQTATAIPLGMAGEEGVSAIPAVGDFLAGRAGGNLLTQGASRIAGGALQGGGTAAALSSAQPNVPVGQQVIQGATTGAIAAPILSAAGSAANRMVSSPTLSSAVSDLANAAINDHGIPLTRDQILAANGDEAAAYRWDTRRNQPLTGGADTYQAQKDAVTKAIAKTFGGVDINGDPATAFTPEVLNAARKDAGGRIGDIAGRNATSDVTPLSARLDDIEQQVQQTPLGDSGQTALQNQIKNIRSTINDGTLSGADYNTLVRHNGPLDLAQHSPDGSVRLMADQLRSSLDNAIQSGMSGQDQADFSLARSQYKNVMTVARAVKSSDINGQLTPSALNTAVNQSFKDRAFRGAENAAGDPGQIADIMRFFMKPPPNSGTAQRISAMLKQNMGPLGVEAGAAGVGALIHDPTLALKMAPFVGAGIAGKLGSNALYGLRNGPSAAANLVAGPGTVGNLLQGGGNLAGQIARGAYVPASVTYNRLMIPNTPQPVPSTP